MLHVTTFISALITKSSNCFLYKNRNTLKNKQTKKNPKQTNNTLKTNVQIKKTNTHTKNQQHKKNTTKEKLEFHFRIGGSLIKNSHKKTRVFI